MSLQLRLTLGMTTIALLGVSAVGTWTTWQMRQMLLVDHKEDMHQIAARLNDELAADPELAKNPARWQSTLDRWMQPNLWMMVKPTRGATVTRAGMMVSNADTIAALPWSEISGKPIIQSVDHRHLVVARQSLYRSGQPICELRLARDITHDYTVLSTLINTLRLATLLVLAMLAGLIAMYIRGSLRPLRRINQLVSQSAGSGQPALLADQVWSEQMLADQPMPSEMQGVVQVMSNLSNRLSETGEKQRAFTNSLSHELRTSLCLIQGYVNSTLRRGDNLTPAQREALDVAASEANRTVHLLQDLLDLGRITSGKAELDLAPIVINDAIDAAIQAVDPDRSHGIEVEAEAMLTVWADYGQLERVLVHLLKNAKQYAKGQPIRLRVESVTPSSEPSTPMAQIQVIDQGCGIPIADQPYIFDPFYRVEASRCRATGGMGLGLAIVKALVEAMGGSVALESVPDAGSTFTIQLPLAQPAQLSTQP